ncbi:L,D-transpeptidase family protein [Bartonella sp. HY329]|uniref:L,D-transpeptidase family protein n=1 Tax=unclassified Bartonella TaxID=2645622 RepID=UPI0021C68EE4|nr:MULTISPECIES: L,D-transpeptidase family protein [unclassified Bartonella]UXM93997.1 L,D-transpeptidase family protein [Bartonella sp. HY329]UXN08319.1 L,D-transpeptidase family protein [Bartonella sp. HY328]
MAKKSSYKSVCILISGAILASLSVNSANSANIFDYFNQKKQERLQREQQMRQQQLMQQQVQPRQIAPVDPAPQPIKRVVVEPPKIFDYRPDKLVEIDFSNVEFKPALVADDVNLLLDNAVVNSDVEAVNNDDNDGLVEVQADALNPDETQFVENARALPAIKAEKQVSDALVKYYASHPKLIWSSGNMLSDKAIAVQKFLKNASDDGLDPTEYMVEFPELDGSAEDAQAILAFDVKFTARLLRYSVDAGAGRVVADRLSAFHDLPRRKIDLDHIIKELAESDQPEKLLANFEPLSPWYKKLKAELAILNAQESAPRIEIANNTVIKPGKTNDELPKIISLILDKAPQTYLGVHRQLLEDNSQNTVYSDELVVAVKDLQKALGKASDGVIGPATIRALQGDNVAAKRQKIITSLERLRWLPHEFSERYVFINQPAYKAQYFEDGKEVLAMKVVVGSQRHQTYFFYDDISLVTFNPTWGVPRSIVMNEMMPRILKDPAYLSRNGYEVFNASGKKVDAGSVNWGSVATKGYGVNIRQKPGTSNALGELKILFPNKHDIYLHDTPSKAAFQRDMRAISHGCVRLADPRAMAAAVMGLEKDGLKRYFGKDERTVKLDVKVPVYLAYFTAWPDAENGSIQYYDDVYNRDGAQQTASDKIKKMRLENM